MPGPINDLIITFTPDEKFRPGPRQVIAQYNRQTGFYEESYKPVVYYATVIIRSFKVVKFMHLQKAVCLVMVLRKNL